MDEKILTPNEEQCQQQAEELQKEMSQNPDLNNPQTDEERLRNHPLADGRVLNDYGEYEWTDEFEENLIALIIRNKEFREKYGHLIKDLYFTTQRARDIYNVACKYLEKYESEPDKSVLKNEMKEAHENYRHRTDPIETYMEAIDRMFNVDVEQMAEYAADKVLDFARRQQLKINLHKISSCVTGKEDELEKCRGLVEEALDIGKEIESPSKPIDLIFPRDTVKGFLKTFADTFSKYFESPYEFWVSAAAVYLGSFATRKVRLETSLKTEPRLYVALVGESASTKKSESVKQTHSFYESVMENNPLLKINVTYGVGSANGLAKFLQKHPTGILQKDEMRELFRKMVIQGSTLLETFTSLFDGNRYSNYTKDEEVDIKDANLSFIGCTTLDIWEEMFDSPSVGTGLANRIWIVPGKTDKEIPNPKIPESGLYQLIVKLRKITETFPESPITILEMDDDAEQVWNEWYHKFKKDEEVGDTTKRLDTYGLRWMMIFAVSERKTIIDKDLVERVITLLEWQRNVRRVLQPKNFDTVLARMEDNIRKVGLEQKELKRGELYKRVHAERKGLDIFNRALKNLENDGVLTINGKKVGYK